jgi:pyruvate/2-oxoglutarate dehydrogenase complex dihydrolipoamide acyltransferase (E2) component
MSTPETSAEVTAPQTPTHPTPPDLPLPPLPPKRKRRWGDRKDGRRLRNIDTIASLSPFLMKTRTGSTNYMADTVEISNMERYIRKKRQEGYKNFGVMHVFLASYVRTVSQRPAINRFVSGQRIYARNNIEVAMTIKKEMRRDAPETCVKMVFEPWETAEEIYAKIDRTIAKEKDSSNLDSDFDGLAKTLRFIPRLLLKFVVRMLEILDYFGWLPKSLTSLSPFHGSLVITSMGSLGIPPIDHHLYDFGNVPIFWAFGAKRVAYEPQRDGEIVERRYIDYRLATDERIVDGYYYATFFKYYRRLLAHPEVLDNPPEEVIRDID